VQDVPLKESWQLLGSTYSVVISGTLMISVSEGVFLYVLVGMALCAAHALLIGPRGRPYLARDTANVLALLFFVVSVLENWLLGRGIITCMGHFLVAVLFIKLYERKPIQGYRLIQVDAVLLITLSGAMTESPAFLPAFVLCAVSLIWHHTTCEMHHGLQMAQKADGYGTTPRARCIMGSRWHKKRTGNAHAPSLHRRANISRSPGWPSQHCLFSFQLPYCSCYSPGSRPPGHSPVPAEDPL